MLENARPIRIAISGGGVAGTTLMHALLQYPNLDVHIFESAPSFKEAGVAVGITRNAKRAWELISPFAVQCLQRAGSVSEKAFHWIMARGPDSGKSIVTIESTDDVDLNNIAHRAEFLREFFADIPLERMHSAKKLLTIDDQTGTSDGSLVLYFSDNTTHECDVLAGADGIRSRVRQFVLGNDDPAAFPVPAGWWFLQVLKPYEEARSVLGKELLDIAKQAEWGYAGEGTFWMHNIFSDGKLAQLVMVVKSDGKEEPDGGRKEVAAEELKGYFSAYPDPVDKAVAELVCDQPTQPTFYMSEHLPARTYVKGSVCVTGDAAHSTTPWNASGAGMSIH